jgi:hypothetical protein
LFCSVRGLLRALRRRLRGLLCGLLRLAHSAPGGSRCSSRGSGRCSSHTSGLTGHQLRTRYLRC